jgi:AraC-like DNA-binding protein
MASPSTQRDPIFAFRIFPSLVALFRERGVPLEPLLDEAGLPPDSIQRDAVTAPLSAFKALFRLAACALNEPSFGLVLAPRIPKGTFELVEFCCRSNHTLDDCLEVFARFIRLINSALESDYSILPSGGAQLRIHVPNHVDGLGAQVNEFSIELILSFASDAVGRRVEPRRVMFAHAAPTSSAVQARFGSACEFGQSSCGIVLSEETIALPLLLGDSALNAFLEARCREALLDVPASMAGRVQRELRAALGGDVGVDAIARRLGLSVRSLQRGLQLEGKSFNEVRDSWRASLAKALLARLDLSVGEVAYLLGYAGARSFERAFQRWFATSPTGFRTTIPSAS